MEQGEVSKVSSVEKPEEEMTMAELLELSEELQKVERGTIIKGIVVSKTHNELLVNIGSKFEGIVRGKDLERVEPEYLKGIEVGDEIPVFVVHLEDEDGYVILSLNKAVVEQDWEKAQAHYESGEILEREVISTNKGGLIVAFGAVRGFVPGSQLDPSHTAAGGDRFSQWSHMLGEQLRLKIIEVDRRRNRLILSERSAMQEVRQQQKEEMLGSLKEGETIEAGRVTSLADFGAFVDLGGAEGLIHLSELSWTQVSHPRDVLKVGEEIDVYVLNIDRERQRIGLSLKRLQPEPWSEVLDSYQPGQIVEAEVTKLTSFGAFARIDNTIEGLIHISELADRQVNHPRDVVKEGESVKVRIISIEPNRRRMGLSLKQVEADDAMLDEEEVSDIEVVEVEAEVAVEEEAVAESEAEAPSDDVEENDEVLQEA